MKDISDCEKRKYHCGYCGNDFERHVRKAGDGKHACSTQIKCKECGNFLSTWN